MDLAHLAYWTGRGSERPSCLRMLALTSSGTRGSAAKAARGSPGAREMMANRTMEMAIRVGMAVTNRRMMYLPMPSLPSQSAHVAAGVLARRSTIVIGAKCRGRPHTRQVPLQHRALDEIVRGPLQRTTCALGKWYCIDRVFHAS